MRKERTLLITQTLLKTSSTKSHNLFANTMSLQKRIKRISILEQHLFKSERKLVVFCQRNFETQ